MTCAVSAFIVVDLPAPLGPSRPTHLPNGTSRSSPSTAVIGPKRLTTLRRRIADSMAIRAYDRRGRPDSSLLAVEVLDARRARREQVLALVAGPDAHLVAVRVRGRRRERDARPHQDPRGRVAVVEQLVGALGALGEEDDVVGREPLGALRRAQRRRAGEHERPLLLAVLVVVRAQRLAGRQLIDAGPGVLRPQALAEAAHARAEALGVLGVVAEVRVGDADAPHGRIVSRRDHALPAVAADVAAAVVGRDHHAVGAAVAAPARGDAVARAGARAAQVHAADGDPAAARAPLQRRGALRRERADRAAEAHAARPAPLGGQADARRAAHRRGRAVDEPRPLRGDAQPRGDEQRVEREAIRAVAAAVNGQAELLEGRAERVGLVLEHDRDALNGAAGELAGDRHAVAVDDARAAERDRRRAQPARGRERADRAPPRPAGAGRDDAVGDAVVGGQAGDGGRDVDGVLAGAGVVVGRARAEARRGAVLEVVGRRGAVGVDAPAERRRRLRDRARRAGGRRGGGRCRERRRRKRERAEESRHQPHRGPSTRRRGRGCGYPHPRTGAGPRDTRPAPWDRWPMPDTTPRTSPRSIALVIVGAVVAVIAAGFLVAGAAVLVADSTKDDDGYLSTSSERFATRTAALATDNLDVNLDGLSDVVSSDHYGKVRLRVAPTNGKHVFVGIARTRDVDAYLGSVAHATVTDIGTGPFRVEQVDLAGRHRAAPPARRDIWSASAHGAGTQTLTWGVEDGSWSVVVMNEDGTPGPAEYQGRWAVTSSPSSSPPASAPASS